MHSGVAAGAPRIGQARYCTLPRGKDDSLVDKLLIAA